MKLHIKEERIVPDIEFIDVETEMDKMMEKNDKYFDEFIDYLLESGLKEKTIGKHLGNVSFYINDYLLCREQEMEEGTNLENLDGFFGDFFIRKCMWSTPQTIRENVAGLNKFYKCMFEKGYISSEQYENYKATVKEYKDEWIDYCRAYNDPNVELFFY